MDKKQSIVLGVVGLASALGLGWMLTRVIKPDEDVPKLSVTMSWE
ncbi:MAG: hypothetical protein WC455_13405 [Dehalococcoidia bacterium]|jgi:hypothetical protein